MKQEIEAALSIIRGLEFRSIGRAADMVWIGIGELVDKLDYKGRQTGTKAGKYALHLQCGWRLSDATRVVLGSGDLLLPPFLKHADLGNIENRFDSIVASGIFDQTPPRVVGIAGDELGGATIALSTGQK